MNDETLNHLGIEDLKQRVRDLEAALGRLVDICPRDDCGRCAYCGGFRQGHYGDCPWEDAEGVLHGRIVKS